MDYLTIKCDSFFKLWAESDYINCQNFESGEKTTIYNRFFNFTKFSKLIFSLKLLWAPIVDALYCRWIGRRKSWMVPCQYLIGGFLLVMSFYVPEILGKEDDKGISSHK